MHRRFKEVKSDLRDAGLDMYTSFADHLSVVNCGNVEVVADQRKRMEGGFLMSQR